MYVRAFARFIGDLRRIEKHLAATLERSDLIRQHSGDGWPVTPQYQMHFGLVRVDETGRVRDTQECVHGAGVVGPFSVPAERPFASSSG